MCYIFFHKLSLDLTNSRAYCQKIKLKSSKIRLNFDFLTKNKGRTLSNKAQTLFYYSDYNKNLVYYQINRIWKCLVVKINIANL